MRRADVFQGHSQSVSVGANTTLDVSELLPEGWRASDLAGVQVSVENISNGDDAIVSWFIPATTLAGQPAGSITFRVRNFGGAATVRIHYTLTRGRGS